MRLSSGHRRTIVTVPDCRGRTSEGLGKGLRWEADSGTLTGALDSNDPGSTSEVLPTHTAALFKAAVKRATELLRAGEVVALPTETVYGLAANALDAAAVQRIFEIKGRPAR